MKQSPCNLHMKIGFDFCIIERQICCCFIADCFFIVYLYFQPAPLQLNLPAAGMGGGHMAALGAAHLAHQQLLLGVGGVHLAHQLANQVASLKFVTIVVLNLSVYLSVAVT